MAVLAASKSCPPVGAAVTCRAVAGKVAVEVRWGAATSLTLDSGKVAASTGPGASRCLARLVPALYGSGILQQTEVDHWLTFSLGPLSCAGAELAKALAYLDSVLQPVTFLVGDAVTVADYEVFGALATSPAALWQLQQGAAPPSLARWWAMMGERPEVKATLAALPAEARTKPAAPQEQAREAKEESAGGKFVELPGAVMGEVVVRFPPEASGYLHVGHAKAALLNNYYKEAFKGKLVMRFDDTNPAKEKEEYEEVILEDLKLLQVKYDMFTRTSDHFETILRYCEKLLKEGKAYVDDTDAETMKIERDAKTQSKNWNNSPEKNLAMWEEMKKGSEAGTKCAVRAKIDMQSNNGCLRDPTIYRCKPEAHPATGTKYKVYPTYDFACPIVDSVEGVTHALRTTEYMDRDDQFNWFIDALSLRKPNIWAYARLNLTNTVMSKRKLTWLVDTGAVDGWDDPRLPTVRGIIRRGLTVEALQQFIIAQGSSRSVVFMEWDKIWAFNKKVLDPVVARHTTVDKANRVPVSVTGVSLGSHAAARHPKNPEVGEKQVWAGPDVLIDGADAEQLKVGENATFINWGNILIKKVNKGADGKVTSVEAEQNLDNKDFKKTLKLTWLCDDKTMSPMTPTLLIYYDHIISKAILDKDDDFKNFVGVKTKHEVEMLGDPELKQLKKGDVVQVQRRGYFICDVPWAPYCQAVGRARPCVLLAIPDGTPTSYGPPGQTKAAPMATKGAKEEKKGGQKKAAKAPTAAPAAAAGGDPGAAVAAQGDLVRRLKTEKAAKPEVEDAVKKLLALKAEYKAATGSDWKPGSAPVKAAPAPAQATGGDPGAAVAAQGELVRKLKTEKAAKPEVEEAVKKLLALKAEYKAATGSDWKPGSAPAPAKAAPAKAASPAPAAGGDPGAAVAAQGDLVRKLKTEKAAKPEVEEAVKKLLALKAEYKAATGSDWKPESAPVKAAPAPAQAAGGDPGAAVAAQGELVRKLKTEKAAKPEVEEAVKKLLALKAEYKAATGSDWKPGAAPAPAKAAPPKAASPIKAAGGDPGAAVAAQGDLVRKLKTEKAAKPEVEEAVKKLLALKAEYKAATGSDWKPGAAPAPAKAAPVNATKAADEGGPGAEAGARVAAQGELVRQLKGDKKPKEEVEAAVKQLLALKAEFKTLTGSDWQAAGGAQPKKQEKKKEKKEVAKPAVPAAGVTRLGLEVKKEESLPDWYSQVLLKAEMMEYYDVSGCYILRPWSFAIWEMMKDFFDKEIKKLGVENCYFPIFVSQAALEREKEHIADFAPEVAWVTKSGDTELAEPIAIRPTSETVMYPAYAKWIQSHRDLPLKLNQWNNVVRWEFKHPQPFLRTREFLWQEGHTAFATLAEAEDEVMTILDLYRRIYEELLAIPVVRGRKTEKEKFAGGDWTSTVEAYISAAGRSIQGATSHHLGQNFSKMFDITFENPETGEKQFVFQNSWGFTTRTIGVLIMVHGDNSGLVLPPRVASIQVVLVPCGVTASLGAADREALYAECEAYGRELEAAGVRVRADMRENYSPGWKFNHWELKGVPIRLEVGPRDMKNGTYVAVRRDTGEKLTMRKAGLRDDLPALLSTIQSSMYARAKAELTEHIRVVTDFPAFLKGLDEKCLLQAPFCGEVACEEEIKELSKGDAELNPNAPSMGAKSLCIPFQQPATVGAATPCVKPGCPAMAKYYTLFGRSY